MARDRNFVHYWSWRITRPLFRLWFRLKYRMSFPPVPELPEHFLMICNHVTNADPFLVVSTLPCHTYFVGTEHLMRLGFRSRLIRFLQDPIPLAKGGNTSTAVLEILRRLKAGRTVTLFAEGNCTWDGRTGSFPSATGKMVRASKAPLVTCRIVGGYFARPRWGYTSRKGPLRLEVVGIYQPEELAAMKPAQINALIERDIREDAYERQLADPQKYPGKDLSLGLQHTLLVCPKCGRFGSLSSTADGFSCECGLTGRYDEYGMLSGEGFDLRTIRDWEDWQREHFRSLPDPGDKETAYTSDEGMVLYQVGGHKAEEEARGTLSGSDLGLHFGDRFFPFADMADLAIRLHGIVTFSMKDGEYYELKKADKSDYSGRKYKYLFDRFGHAAQEADASPKV